MIRPWPRASSRATEAVLLALALLIVAVAAGRDLGTPASEFDEGVYLASARALNDGAGLGTEVFASQPPLFFVGLRAADAATGGDAMLMRLAVLLLVLGGLLAAAAIVRPLAGPMGGCLAVLLVGLSPAVADRAAVVSADLPSIAIGLMAIAAGARAARHPAWAFAAGGLAVAAVLVKLLAVPFALALLFGAWRARIDRRGWLLGVAGAAAVALAVLLPFAGALGELWDGVVGIRGAARGVAVGGGGLDAPFVFGLAGLALAGAGFLLLAPPPSWRPWLEERATLLALAAAAVVLLALQRPLFLHHWALLSVPLAVLVASAAPRRPAPAALVALGLAVVLLAPGAIRGRDVLGPRAHAELDRAAAILGRSTSPTERVVSDLPLVPLTAGRPAVPSTIDASRVRVGSGSLTGAEVLRAADGAAAVVMGRAFREIPGLRVQLAGRFPRTVRIGRMVVLLRGAATGSTR